MNIFKAIKVLYGLAKSYSSGNNSKTGDSVIDMWAKGTDVRPNDVMSLLSAYRNLVYTCAKTNAENIAKQKIHLYAIVPRTKKQSNFMLMDLSPTEIANLGITSPNEIKSVLKYNDELDVKEVIDHPFLDLFNNPGNNLTYFEFMTLTILFLELTGDAYWKPNPDMTELTMLYPQYMSITSKNNMYPDEYIFNGTVRIMPDDIVHVKYPNPQSYLHGKSPLSAVCDAVDIENYSNTYGKSILKNSGVLAGYFRTDLNLGDAEFDRIKAELQKYKGFKNAGKTPLLDNGLTYEPVAISPEKLFNIMANKKTEKDIARAFGLPISKIDVDNVNKANAAEGSNDYERETLLPKNIFLQQVINKGIISKYPQKKGVKLFCAFDNPAKEDNNLMLKKMVEYIKWGVFSPNEVRKFEGYAPRNYGDDYLIPVNYTISNGKDWRDQQQANNNGGKNNENESKSENNGE